MIIIYIMWYNVKKKSFLLYQWGWYFKIIGDPCHLIGSHGHDEHHMMDKLWECD